MIPGFLWFKWFCVSWALSNEPLLDDLRISQMTLVLILIQIVSFNFLNIVVVLFSKPFGTSTFEILFLFIMQMTYFMAIILQNLMLAMTSAAWILFYYCSFVYWLSWRLFLWNSQTNKLGWWIFLNLFILLENRG